MKTIFIIIFSFIITNSYSQFQKYDTVKLIIYNNMLFTKVTLNGQKALLLIDTGASKSILDINRAEEFGFKVDMTLDTTRRYIGIGGLTEIFKVYEYKIDEYRVSFLGSDLSYVNEYLYKNYIPIAGVLGGDFFIKNHAIIDYKKKMVFIK